MPASGLRVLYVMSCGGRAITETQVLLGQNQVSDVPNLQKVSDLFKARLALSGYPTIPVRARISLVGSKRVYFILPISYMSGIAPVQNNFKDNKGNLVTNDSDQPKSCLQLAATNGDTVHKTIYLSGVPDVLIGQPDPGGHIAVNPWWLPLYNTYANLLKTGGWGFIARTANAGALAPVNINSYSTDGGTGYLQFVVTGQPAAFVQGAAVQIIGSKMVNRAYAPANGRWIISKVEPATPAAGSTRYTVLQSTQVPSAGVAVMGQVQLVDYTSYAYTAPPVIVGDTTRKRGNRVLAPAGRRTIRKYLPI